MASRRIKSLLVLCLSLFTLAYSSTSFANEKVAHAAGQAEKEFNVTETILEHIKDDHSWH